MATTAKIAKDEKLASCQGEQDAEARVPASQPLQAVRTAARLPAQVHALPHLLPQARAGRRDPRRDEGELVTGWIRGKETEGKNSSMTHPIPSPTC